MSGGCGGFLRIGFPRANVILSFSETKLGGRSRRAGMIFLTLPPGPLLLGIGPAVHALMQRTSPCPRCANSGNDATRRIVSLFDYLVCTPHARFRFAAPHGLHKHAENSARRACRAQERSDLSQLVVCRPPQLVARPRPLYEHWRGPRSVGARYSLQKEKCSVLNNHRRLFFSYSWQHLGHIKPRGEERYTMAKMMKTAERALHKRTNKMLASATKRYKKLCGRRPRRQATINAKSIWPRL